MLATHAHHRWGWLLGIGSLLTLIGISAISMSAMATLISIQVFSLCLATSGILMVIHAIQDRPAGNLWMNIALGILYVVSGTFLFTNPITTALTLTLFMAGFFIVSGVIRCIMAAAVHAERWGLFFANGLVNIMLGALIWAAWPMSGIYLIGMFLGIDLVFTGCSLMALGWQAHQVDGLTTRHS